MFNQRPTDPIPEVPATVCDFLADCARMFKNRTAVVEHHGEDRKSLTYRQMTQESMRISSYLLQNGIRKHDRIALLSENRIEWVILAFAVVNIGAVLVPLDTNLTHEDLIILMKRASIKMLCISRTFISAAVESRDQIDETLPILCFDPTRTGDNFLNWCDLQHLPLPEELHVSDPVLPEDTAVIVFTSGTTSFPKAVALTHRNIMSSAWWTFRHTGVLNSGSRLFFPIPLFHTFTLVAGFLAPLMTGAIVIIGSTLKPAQFQLEILCSKPTLLVGVPLIFESLLNSIQDNIKKKSFLVRGLLKIHASLTNLKGPRSWSRFSRKLYKRVHERFGRHVEFLVSGGAPLSPKVKRELERMGFFVIQGYGLTEAGPVIASESTLDSRMGSVGKVLSHLTVRIAAPDQDGVGEIQVKGQGIMPGYEGAPEMNQEAFEEGWLKTGDLGYVDRDGFLFICGRNKDLIVTPGGKKIYPEDLERSYLQSTWIREMCIYEKDGPSGYEGLMATIVANPDASAEAMTEEGLREVIGQELRKIGDQLPLYKRINDFVLSKDGLPRTTFKKLKRQKIRAEAQGLLQTQDPSNGRNNHGNRPLGRRILARLNHGNRTQ